MVEDEQARAAAREILAERRFARWDEDFEAWLRAFEALVDRVPAGLIEALRWLEEILVDTILAGIARALGRFLALFGVFGNAPTAVGWLALLLLLAAAIVLAHRIWGAALFSRESTEVGFGGGAEHAEAIDEARVIAGQGRFLEAAHRVQLATLAMLIDFDRLELARSDPNRTLRERVEDSSLPDVERAQLIALVDRLERLWFDEPVDDPALFEDWLALDARLLRWART